MQEIQDRVDVLQKELIGLRMYLRHLEEILINIQDYIEKQEITDRDD